jgi:hypothetical protein
MAATNGLATERGTHWSKLKIKGSRNEESFLLGSQYLLVGRSGPRGSGDCFEVGLSASPRLTRYQTAKSSINPF